MGHARTHAEPGFIELPTHKCFKHYPQQSPYFGLPILSKPLGFSQRMAYSLLPDCPVKSWKTATIKNRDFSIYCESPEGTAKTKLQLPRCASSFPAQVGLLSRVRGLENKGSLGSPTQESTKRYVCHHQRRSGMCENIQHT